jgi:hypothetical protein
MLIGNLESAIMDRERELCTKALQRHLAGKLRVFGNVDLAIPPLPSFSRIL